VRKFIPPIFLALTILIIYLGTIAPGLTWANDGADGGDLITAAATGGIAHPSGYPVYLLLARLFQFLPVGSLAFRTNLLSALAAVLAVLIVYGILVWPENSPVYGNWPAGLIGGFFFGLSPLLWSQAVITEVYTLHAAFTALAILMAVWAPGPASKARVERWRGVLLGLAVGNQLTSVFLIPPVLVSGIWKGNWKFEWKSLIRMSVWLGAGLLVYLILPIRALSKPPVNWGNPSTFNQFVWLVSGNLYQRHLLAITFAGILERSQTWVTLLLQQFGLPGLMLGIIGLVYYFKTSRLYLITVFNAIVFSLFAILYASFDSYVYLIPVFLSFAIWIGLGVGGLLESAGKYKKPARVGALILFSVLFFALAINRWPGVDASHDLRAEQFGAHAMQIIPKNAIVFTQSDQAIFALWYFHFALKQRPDIAVVATDLIQFDWYANTLRSIYPSINWNGDFLWVETITMQNPSHPICTVSYWDTEEITCKAAGQASK
jgi:Protein of unknown function (DUF2723)